MRDEFYSEKISGRVPTYTRKEYSERLLIYFDAEDKTRQKAQEEYKLKGTKKYTRAGLMDRLAAKPYSFNIICPQKANTDGTSLTGDERSYYYGYYTLANEKLINQIKFADVRVTPSIENVGFNDAQNNISLEELPEEIKKCKEYLIGYKKGIEETKKKNKSK